MTPTQRFSTRVENYVRYRPHYPVALIALLKERCHLEPLSIVADIGSGPGILSELFLQNGNRVYAVEPNAEMRQAGEQLFGHLKHFTSVSGSAEQTGLPTQCVDFIAAGQAFHWFDPRLCQKEFARILRPRGWVVLVWNDRRIDSPFLRDYDCLLQEFATDYDQTNHKRIDEQAISDFLRVRPEKSIFPNQQLFDIESLKGRLLSASYAPEAGHPKHEPMLKRLREICDKHGDNGRVALDYDTTIYIAQPPW